MQDHDWDIRLQGRAWPAGQAFPRIDLVGSRKIEMFDGKLFFSEAERVVMLGLLLENVGAERAVQLGDPAVWRAAVEKLREN